VIGQDFSRGEAPSTQEIPQAPPEGQEEWGGDAQWDDFWEKLEERLQNLEKRQENMVRMMNGHIFTVGEQLKLYERFFAQIAERFHGVEEQIEIITNQLGAMQMDIDEKIGSPNKKVDFTPRIQNLESSVMTQDQVLVQLHQKMSKDENDKKQELFGVKRQVLGLGNASQKAFGTILGQFDEFQRNAFARIFELEQKFARMQAQPPQ
jgi:hypothetical protein